MQKTMQKTTKKNEIDFYIDELNVFTDDIDNDKEFYSDIDYVTFYYITSDYADFGLIKEYVYKDNRIEYEAPCEDFLECLAKANVPKDIIDYIDKCSDHLEDNKYITINRDNVGNFTGITLSW